MIKNLHRTTASAHPATRRALLTILLAAAPPAGAQGGIIGTFPDVAAPNGNPVTADKAMLGKALFFEEQLSSDNTMSCATCHLPEAGGADLFAGARAPGRDGLFDTPDDVFGSPGMVRQDRNGDFARDTQFGVRRRVTERSAPSVIGAAFFRSLFWDLRARPTLRDEAGNIVLAENAALETQAVAPPLSPVEMGHEQIEWRHVVAKLERVKPLRLASALPPDLASFLNSTTRYAPLFERVFGSPGVTRERIAMAIATYERTLVADRTPFDLGTMTAQQADGFDVFRTKGNCATCHSTANRLFSDGQLHTIGLPNHNRSVKTPSLRNVGLRRRFMHSGQFSTLDQVVRHYESVGFFLGLTDDDRAAVITFLGTALTDPRVRDKLPPFDRPTLHIERLPPGANLFGRGSRGTGGFIPKMLATSPSNLGHDAFQIGIGDALGGSVAILALSSRPMPPDTVLFGIPVHVDPLQGLLRAVPLSGNGAGAGVATVRLPIPETPALIGALAFWQWFVFDPSVASEIVATPGAVHRLFDDAR